MGNDRGQIGLLLSSSRPTISFEFFPPKDEQGFESLRASFAELSKLSPDFISVTYGAMGSNQDRSLAVVQEFANQVPTIAHLTCIGATTKSLTSLLDQYATSEVAAILALRGDLPKDYVGAPFGDFATATDLVELVKVSSFEIGVAAFPEKHPESPSLEHDLAVLKIKQDAGASFAMTQLFFDIEAYFDLVSAAREVGIVIPVVPGLMPIANAKQVLRMAEMSGARVPDVLLKSLELAEDENQARAIGMEFSVNLAKELISRGAPGLHIFTLNHHRAAIELLQGAGLA
jgi:methylenetetrahydrofolate reductase (NADPH)